MRVEPGATKPFPWAAYFVALTIVVFLAALPFISVFFTYFAANALGCEVNEASVQPCMALGIDIGGLLYATGVMGWLMLISIPLGIGALFIWLTAIVMHWIWHWRMSRGT